MALAAFHFLQSPNIVGYALLDTFLYAYFGISFAVAVGATVFILIEARSQHGPPWNWFTGTSRVMFLAFSWPVIACFVPVIFYIASSSDEPLGRKKPIADYEAAFASTNCALVTDQFICPSISTLGVIALIHYIFASPPLAVIGCIAFAFAVLRLPADDICTAVIRCVLSLPFAVLIYRFQQCPDLLKQILLTILATECVSGIIVGITRYIGGRLMRIRSP